MAASPSNHDANRTNGLKRLSFSGSTSRELIEFFRVDAQFFPGVSGSGESHEKVQVLSTSSPAKKAAIKKWKRVKPLGGGATSTVWLEECQGSEFNQRAVKELSKRPRPLLRSKIDYEKELTALCQMAKYHHAFVNLLGWFESPEAVFLCMEYFPLGDLAHFAYEALDEPEVQIIAEQLTDGLNILHGLGWVHRDLKPENVYVARSRPNWWVKLGDFSVSKRNYSDDRMNTMVGTPNFAAPEIIPGVLVNTADGAAYTSAVDLWSLGALLYSLLTNRVPFSSNPDLRSYCRSYTPFPSDPLLDKRVSEHGLNFLKALLDPNPPTRLSAADALEHSWFGKLKQQQDGFQSPLIDLGDPSRRRASPIPASIDVEMTTAPAPAHVNNAVVEELLDDNLSNGPGHLPQSEIVDFQYANNREPTRLKGETAEDSRRKVDSDAGRALGPENSVLQDSEPPLNKALHSRAEQVRVLQEQAKKPRLHRQPRTVGSEQNKESTKTTGPSTSSRLPALQKGTPFPNTNNETTETVGTSGNGRLQTSRKRTPFPKFNVTFLSGEDEAIALESEDGTSSNPYRVKWASARMHGVATQKEKSTVSSSSRSNIAQDLGHQPSSSSAAKEKLRDNEPYLRPQSILVDSRERRPYQLNANQLSTRSVPRAIAGPEATRNDARIEVTSDGENSESHRNNTARRVNIATSTKDTSLEDMQSQVPAQTVYPANYSANSAYYSYPNPYSVSSNQPPPSYMYPYQAPGLQHPTIEMGKSSSSNHQPWPHTYPAFNLKSTSRASGSNIGHNDFRKTDDPRLVELKELFLANKQDQDQESRFRAMLKDQEEKYVKLLRDNELEAERKVTERKEQATKQETNLENIRATAWQQGRMAGIEETRHLTISESTGRIPTIVEHPKGFPLNDQENLAPVIMRDELGRNLLFPYSKCRTWFVSLLYLSSPSYIIRMKKWQESILATSYSACPMRVVYDTNFRSTGLAKLDTTGVPSL